MPFCVCLKGWVPPSRRFAAASEDEGSPPICSMGFRWFEGSISLSEFVPSPFQIGEEELG